MARSIATARPLASAIRAASINRPSDTSIIAWPPGQRAPLESRLRAAVRREATGPLFSPRDRKPAPASPIVPVTQSDSPARAPARGGAAGIAADRGQPQHARRAGGHRTVSPPISGTSSGDRAAVRTAEAASQRVVGQAAAEQDALDRAPWRQGRTGSSPPASMPRRRRGRARKTHALDERVVGQHQSRAVDVEDSGVVAQSARGGIGGDAAQRRDEIGFVGHRRSLGREAGPPQVGRRSLAAVITVGVPMRHAIVHAKSVRA